MGHRESDDLWPLIWVNLVLSTYEIAIDSVNPCKSKGAYGTDFEGFSAVAREPKRP